MTAKHNPGSLNRRPMLAALLGLALAGGAMWFWIGYTWVCIPAFWFAAAIIAWLLLRYGRANPIGVGLWGAAAAMLSLSSWRPIFQMGFIFPTIGNQFKAFGALLFLIAAAIFCFTAISNAPRRTGNCVALVVALFSIITPGACSGTIARAGAWPENIQETRLLLIKLHRLSAEIEAIRAKIGRLPKDEAELVALRGEPLPTYYQKYRIRYYPADAFNYRDRDQYRLECSSSHFWGEHWDFWPWIFHFYDRKAVKRLYAEVF